MKINTTHDCPALRDNPKIMRDFASAIITQAILDYVKRPHLRDEVRRFFKSEWGEFLCDSIDIDSATILKKLERGKINRKGL